MAKCTEEVKKINYYGNYYSLDGFSGTIYFQGVVNDNATILQGFVIALAGPFFPDEQAAEEGQDIVPILNDTAQTFPTVRFVDNGKFHKMTAEEIAMQLSDC